MATQQAGKFSLKRLPHVKELGRLGEVSVLFAMSESDLVMCLLINLVVLNLMPHV